MWTDEFLQLFGKATISLDDVKAAQELKNTNLPPKIFKFRIVNKYALDNLKNDTLWMCSADKYNDPYDCASTFSNKRLLNANTRRTFDSSISKFNIRKFLSDEEIERARISPEPLTELGRLMLKKEPNIPSEQHEELLEKLLNTNISLTRTDFFLQKGTKICSFSSRSDSVVMWGHYADSHKGFCVEYDTSDLDVLRRHMLYPVIYSDNLFDVTKFFEQKERESNNLFAVLAAIHKSSDWSYENEWRFVAPLGESLEDQNVAVPTPSAIYLGSRMSEDCKQKVFKIVEGKGMSIYKMRPSTKKFKLESHPLIKGKTGKV